MFLPFSFSGRAEAIDLARRGGLILDAEAEAPGNDDPPDQDGPRVHILPPWVEHPFREHAHRLYAEAPSVSSEDLEEDQSTSPTIEGYDENSGKPD